MSNAEVVIVATEVLGSSTLASMASSDCSELLLCDV